MTPRKTFRLVVIAELLGVSKQRADQFRRRADFPAPVGRYERVDLRRPRTCGRTWGGGSARWGPRHRSAETR
jgi:hypothetical protein